MMILVVLKRVAMNRLILLTLSFLFLSACSGLSKKVITQGELISLTDKIDLVSANGFICEKEGAGDRESIVEWTCGRDSSKFDKGTDCDKKLMKQFTASAVGPIVTRVTQVIDGVVVSYDPLSGCLSFVDQKEKKSWVFNSMGEISDFKHEELKDKCPIKSKYLKWHPMGFVMMSDVELD